MHLACVLMHMSMSEALIAATLNSAAALGLSDLYGSIEKGKYADMVVINADRLVVSPGSICLVLIENASDIVVKKSKGICCCLTLFYG